MHMELAMMTKKCTVHDVYNVTNSICFYTIQIMNHPCSVTNTTCKPNIIFRPL